MALYIVATPIGHPDDITQRAKDCLERCDILILEEFKEGSKLIRQLGFPRKDMRSLNEHTQIEDLQELYELCQSKDCALISDCGTPNFCDPGAELVRMCRKGGVKVKSLPGPSSLMLILSLSSMRLDQFVFRGFLPANTQQRQHAIKDLVAESRAIVLMDTPYRLNKTLSELAVHWPQRKALLALNLTQDSEQVHEGSLLELNQNTPRQKAEFILLIYPSTDK